MDPNHLMLNAHDGDFLLENASDPGARFQVFKQCHHSARLPFDLWWFEGLVPNEVRTCCSRLSGPRAEG